MSPIFHPLFCIILAASIFITLCGGAVSAEEWVIHFESDDGLWTLPPEKDTGGARIKLIGQDEGAISGRRSLQGDSMGLETAWHEFLHTTDKVALKPGTRYYIYMQAHIADIDMGERGRRPAFYFLLRSRSRGPSDSADVYGPFWLREAGAHTEVGAVLTTREGITDYYLNIGIRDRARLIIDDITIREIGSTPSPAAGKAIKPMPADDHPSWDVLSEHRKRHGLARMLDEMTVVGIFEMCNGTMTEVVEFMRDMVKPDAIDWASARYPAQWDVAKVNGSWYTTSSMEYQEHYKVEEPELWDRRWEILLPSGMTRTLSGQINYWETFGEGGYFMCHNGPFWNRYFRNRTSKLVNRAQGICQDNIGVPPFTTAGGCFCEFCEERFMEHLSRVYTRAELKAMGVNDPECFSLRRYVLDNGLMGDIALDDALAKEYIRFQHITHRDRWMEHAAAFKQKADEAGRPISTSGNQIFMTGPFSIMLSPTNDIIEVERLEYFPDYRLRNTSHAYKIGCAAGYNERPVWFRGTNHIGPDRDLNTSWVCQEAQYGEAAANGGIRVIHMADDHWPKLEVTTAFTRIPEMREMTEGWANLLRQNRAIFSGRESLARTALVYSMPAMMWHDFSAFDLSNWSLHGEFEKASLALDAAHVPHDVLVLGYPGLWDDAWSLDRMSRYEALVIPNARCVSDAHIEALIRYAENGGRLYIADGFGAYNEHYEPRTRESIERLLRAADGFKPSGRSMSRIASRHGLKTDAPEKLVINPWLSANGHALTLHVVNYDLHAGSNYLNKPGEVTVEVRLPEGRRTPYDSAYLLTAGGSGRPPRVSYDFGKGTATVRFELERPYGAVVLADAGGLLAAEKEIRIRRERMKSELRVYNTENMTWPPPDPTGE